MAESEEAKKVMTNEERLALGAKLDNDLDDFIAGLEKRQYTEGWPEDRWQEEMEKHPFFMTKPPKEGEPLNPLLEGIQQLKYDDSANSPIELAINYKEDGNFNFKCKKYRMAILSYTEGIRKKCGDAEVESQLYNNRGASHYFLQNYRSSLRDCLTALKFKPTYHKARIRAAQCYIELHQCDEAIKLCDEVLITNPTDPQALQIRTKAVAILKKDERDKRKRAVAEKRHDQQLNDVLNAIQKRGIKLQVAGDVKESLELCLEKPELVEECLMWQVFFLYPEYNTSDYIQQFNENSTFLDHLKEMFNESPDWDVKKDYVVDKLCLYYEGENRENLYQVKLDATLKETLSLKTFVVKNWKPTFFIVVQNSKTETLFKKDYKVHHLTR